MTKETTQMRDIKKKKKKKKTTKIYLTVIYDQPYTNRVEKMYKNSDWIRRI